MVFVGGMLDVIVLVPDHCLFIYFLMTYCICHF